MTTLVCLRCKHSVAAHRGGSCFCGCGGVTTRRSMVMLSCWMLVFTMFFTACSGLSGIAPLVPTPLTPETEAGLKKVWMIEGDLVVRWEETAPGCVPYRPASEPEGIRPTQSMRDQQLLL